MRIFHLFFHPIWETELLAIGFSHRLDGDFFWLKLGLGVGALFGSVWFLWCYRRAFAAVLTNRKLDSDGLKSAVKTVAAIEIQTIGKKSAITLVILSDQPKYIGNSPNCEIFLPDLRQPETLCLMPENRSSGFYVRGMRAFSSKVEAELDAIFINGTEVPMFESFTLSETDHITINNQYRVIVTFVPVDGLSAVFRAENK